MLVYLHPEEAKRLVRPGLFRPEQVVIIRPIPTRR